jgi:hypothetical protein
MGASPPTKKPASAESESANGSAWIVPSRSRTQDRLERSE